MGANDVELNFDRENDDIFVVKKLANREKMSSIVVNPDVVLLVEDKVVVGFQIDDFSKVIPHMQGLTDYHLMEAFDGFIDLMNQAEKALSRP